MINVSHNFIEDCRIWLLTVFRLPWLWKNKYDYTLTTRRLRRLFSWSSYAAELQHEIKALMPKLLTDKREWHIVLTPFGTYGSYEFPNRVIVNVIRIPHEAAATVVHEVGHLLGGPDETQYQHHEREQRANEHARDYMSQR